MATQRIDFIDLAKGYRILAVDGTAVNIPRNPKSDSFMCNKSAPKGYNQLHVTAIQNKWGES